MRRLSIAQIGDTHVHVHSRFLECIRLLNWIADDAAARGCAMTVHTGDMYDKPSVPEERNAAERWVSRCAEFGPVVLIKGNHDAEGDLAIMRRLRTTYPVIVEERSGTHLVTASRGSGAPNQPIAVACLSWPRKGHLLAQLAQPVSHEQSNEVAQHALRDVLRGLGQELDRHGKELPNLLAAHAMVTGSITSVGQPLVGKEMEIDLSDLALTRAKFVALGHIHKQQDWAFNGVPIAYAGSHRRTAYGELEPKGYIVAHYEEASDGWHLADWEHVIAPATPMLDVVSAWRGEGAGLVGECDWQDAAFLARIRGADVRFRYVVPADAREPARLSAEFWRQRFLDAGAIEVALDPEAVPVTRARAPEIATAMTLFDKLETLWRLRQIEHPPARVIRLRDKVGELERLAEAA